ncbi:MULTISPECIES: CvpA family protein [Halomonadaceae]|jgi:membrane protein required for colicin V production|uniref:Colicin V biosynthesis protein n=2 Tax=Vreelandella TaxID=3137766 RepID=A0A0D7V3X3_9GAMM|nr:MULTISPECIES: CvpA family protein [Halomonas]KTG25488.1 colicin V production protein [Idiomarina sp. H105]MEC9021028.1 CvpA family protein [Pseudomonadota bacterium]OAE96114.1 colicin V production protein [Idiomarina sp. WRN-38]KJD20392.1 colicin V production protein [Halomonas meridiana]MAD20913.1 colicin V production protein [Halomonas sp.]|tara:strand:+ start:157 stop:735 length:579 start_codon:yes stop_codon:yes gene_type:complete
MALTWIDALFLAVLGLSMLAGFVRGFVRESLGLAAWVVALMVARVLAEPVAELMSGFIESFDARLVLAFALVIFAVILLCGIVIRVVHAAVEWVGMGLLNRFAGAAFGIARGAVILLVATVLITLTPLAELQAWQQASLRPTFIELRDWAVSQLDQWERELPTPPESLRDISLPELRRPQPTLPSSSAPEVE